MALRHDSQGFLAGDAIDIGRALSAWSDIRADVRAIRQAMSGGSKNQRPAPAPSAGRPIRPAATPGLRDNLGRFVRRDSPGPAPDRQKAVTRPAGRTRAASSSESDQTTSRAHSPVTPVTPVTPAMRAGSSGARTESSSGPAVAGDGVLRGLFERLAGAASATGGALENADPAVKAAQEVAQPLARGYGMLTGNRSEKRKEGWFRRIYGSLAGFRKEESVFNKAANKSLKNLEDKPVSGGADGDGGFWSKIFGSGLLTAFIPVIAAIGTGLVAMAPVIAAALAVALAVWLAKKALETPAGVEAKANFDKGVAEQASPVRFAPPVLDASGRNMNDPRRLDRAGAMTADGRMINDPRRIDAAPLAESTELPPATSMAQRAGRFAGWAKRIFKNGTDLQGDAGDPVNRSKMTKKQRAAADLKQRSLETGAQYSAGNIGGLDDTQTRALVASTVMTESHGGDPRAINPSNGFMGRYQAGAGWLSDAGLIKGGNGALKKAMAKDGFTLGGPGQEDKWGQQGGMTRFLKDDANWNNGLSYEKYLGSADTQDKAFKTNSDAAYNSLMKNPAVKDKSPENMAGLLKARHIAGLGGAVRMAQGMTGAADSNGTTARKYYDDVAKDKDGFLVAYTSGAASARMAAPAMVLPVQTAFAAAPKAPTFAAPPPIADAPPVINPLGTGADSKRQISVTLPAQDVGQDVKDRRIAHIATGAIGFGG